jgi:Tfp pilus assembly protein PilF
MVTVSASKSGSTVPWQRLGSAAWLLALPSALLLLSGCGDDRPPVSDANKLFLEAIDFLAKGQTDKAMDALNASIAADPTVWAYRERAKLRAQQGNDKDALDDCRAALVQSPDDPDILWLQGEFAKPTAERSQGRFKRPPSDNR